MVIPQYVKNAFEIIEENPYKDWNWYVLSSYSEITWEIILDEI